MEVDTPRARILAVDDEPVVLDSFRKILVLDGYSVDTVETGQEALGLIQKKEYDFVFTDLKMPGLDGVEVTKAVKHLRPDIDVVMITGYATVESAVGTMKHGALDYVEKPFTEDELTSFVNKCADPPTGQDRAGSASPRSPGHRSSPEDQSERVYNVPAGVFVSPAHVWLRIEMTGEARIGVDDFARKTIGAIDDVGLPEPSRKVTRGQTLFSLKQNGRRFAFPAPVSGTVIGDQRRAGPPPRSREREPLRRGLDLPYRPRRFLGRAGDAAHRRRGARPGTRTGDRALSTRSVSELAGSAGPECPKKQS